MAQTGQIRQENFFWIDLIRVLASIGVILVHVAADVITEWRVLPDDWWWTAHLYNSLSRGCVALFIMLSGAMLLPKQEPARDFFKKRFHRVMIPFIAWVVIYLVWRKIFYEPDMTLLTAFQKTLSAKAHFHLWFLYALTGLYLLTPLFRRFLAGVSERGLVYFLGLWFFAGILLPWAESLTTLLGLKGFHAYLPLEPVQGFIGYFVLGHYLRQYGHKIPLSAAGLVWLASLAMCLGGTYFLALRTHQFRTIFYDNLAPNVILYGASLFVFARAAGSWMDRHISGGFRKAFLLLSEASFGIYLIHPMFLDAMIKGRWGFVLKADMLHPLWTIPAATAVTLLLSFAATLGIQKIPCLRRIV